MLADFLDSRVQGITAFLWIFSLINIMLTRFFLMLSKMVQIVW